VKHNNGYHYDGAIGLGALANQFAHGDQPPSSYAITSWVKGEPWGATKALGVTVMRTAPIAAGVWLGQKWFPKSVWGTAATVSVTLSLMIAGMKVWGEAKEGPSNANMGQDLGRQRRVA